MMKSNSKKSNRKITEIMDMQFTQMLKDDYLRLKPLFAKGVNIPIDGMDYSELYGILALMYDLEVPLSKIHLGGRIEETKNMRNLVSELPYTMQIDALGVSFVVKKWQDSLITT